MKKLISFVLSLTLIFTIFVMPSSAETSVKDWAKAEGSHGIFFDEEGTKITLSNALNFYYYKNQVNVTDFTITIKLNALNVNNWGAWIITIGSGKYSGTSNGYTNVIFLRPKSDGTLAVQPALLYGAGLDNSTKIFKGDYKNNYITIRGKKVNDNTYSLDFNNGELYYEYSIPENQNYIENLGNGMGYLGFGSYGQSIEFSNSIDSPYNIVVKEINGVKMNVKNSSSSSNSSSVVNSGIGNTSNDKTSNTTSSNNNSSNLNSNISSEITESTNSGTTGTITEEPIPNTNNNSDKNNKSANEEKSKNNNIILIVIGSLVMIPFIVIAIIIISKKKSAKASVQDVVNEKLQE